VEATRAETFIQRRGGDDGVGGRSRERHMLFVLCSRAFGLQCDGAHCNPMHKFWWHYEIKKNDRGLCASIHLCMIS
jgi:hypothetical protein